MFTTKQLERYADVLWWGLNTAKKAPFKKNDIILIRYNRPAVQLAEILFAKLLTLDLNPVQRMNPTAAMERAFYLRSSNTQLVFTPPGEKELMSGLNGSINLYAPESITHLSDVDPKKIGKSAVAQKALRDILDRREARGSFSWTLCVFPTAELAEQAGIEIGMM
ncbi:MAG: aminopeptidase, partial [Desulfobacterales bacterium]